MCCANAGSFINEAIAGRQRAHLPAVNADDIHFASDASSPEQMCIIGLASR